jgi:hypothetical protein
VCVRDASLLLREREKPLNKQFMFSLRNTVCLLYAFWFFMKYLQECVNEEEIFAVIYDTTRIYVNICNLTERKREKILPSQKHTHLKEGNKVCSLLCCLMKVVGRCFKNK